ncbi:hypothetical protein IV102_01265 [bacterium]|nr:hypothetical protein [bacterium]
MIDSNANSVRKFNQIKDQIRDRAKAGEQVKVDGDNFQVVESFSVSDPEGNYTVLKDSRFDNDLKTRDKVSISLEPKGDLVKETRDYEHYSQKKLVFFTDERLSVTVQQVKQNEGGFSHLGGSSDFSV